MGAGGSSQQSSRLISSKTTAGAATTNDRNATATSSGQRGETSRTAAPGRSAAADNPTLGLVVSYKMGDVLPLIVRHLEPNEMLSKGVGMVIEGTSSAGHTVPPPPPEMNPEETVFGWFVENLEKPGTWEPYAKESSDRLEEAFLNMRSTCAVVMKKRSYTVNLQTMQQMPAESPANIDIHPVQQQRIRKVRRAPVVTYSDPDTGELRTREAPLQTVDPFSDEGSDNHGESEKIAKGDGDIVVADARDAPFIATAEDGYLPHLIRTVVPHHLPIYTIECTPEVAQLCPEARAVVEPAGGALLLSSGRDMQLLEWSLETSTVVTRYALPRTSPKNSVLTANYSSTGKWVVAGLDDRTARLYAIGNPDEVHLLKGHTHKVYGAGVLPGDLQVATASMDCQVKLWDIEGGTCVRTVVAHKSHIFALRPHPTDPNFALTAGEDRVVCMHDFRQENSVAAVFRGLGGTVWDIDWNPVTATFATGGIDSSVRIFDPRVSTTAVEILRTHSHAVHSVKYTPRGRGLLSSSKNSFVCLNDTTNWSLQWKAKAHAATVFRVRYHTGKSVMVTASSDASVNLWSWGALRHL
ncbi:hypothetical protein JKF63_04167 [Porcisia hertigi]|uniref:WWE domain-containing protein n=1 Tax=Porcisia hertigi TaxID=2761500 RepID=A0A836HLA8_9TRYP|nr:hypothetical protein JKF63_04167 [Porcisia hertigi]